MLDRDFELRAQAHQEGQAKPLPSTVRYLLRDIEVARRRKADASREMADAEGHLQRLLNLLHRITPHETTPLHMAPGLRAK